MLIAGGGVVVGFFLGRSWAEVRRARFDQRQVWNGRKRYRS
ncbi:hypothetical protein [Actinomycetospora termitidis]|uniref:Uncharacterized protein n=1 Tax=Actinomycetospora termitidis TaxID=3053470 RepID=A0ABT7MFA5_9PSEU|nr:hypothetical protein [Actinomycetospora sp. Odt1-22]MDL5158567.1 hypothetical protein [Actinomycetospora sp. Odt1-22]